MYEEIIFAIKIFVSHDKYKLKYCRFFNFSCGITITREDFVLTNKS